MFYPVDIKCHCWFSLQLEMLKSNNQFLQIQQYVGSWTPIKCWWLYFQTAAEFYFSELFLCKLLMWSRLLICPKLFWPNLEKYKQAAPDLQLATERKPAGAKSACSLCASFTVLAPHSKHCGVWELHTAVHCLLGYSDRLLQHSELNLNLVYNTGLESPLTSELKTKSWDWFEFGRNLGCECELPVQSQQE